MSTARASRRAANGSGVDFDAVFTAEEIGSYKPDLENFRYMIDALERSGHPAA